MQIYTYYVRWSVSQTTNDINIHVYVVCKRFRDFYVYYIYFP